MNCRRRDSTVNGALNKALTIVIAGSGWLVVSSARAQFVETPPGEPPEQRSYEPDPSVESAGQLSHKPASPVESVRPPTQALTPPLDLPTRETFPSSPVNPWFVRPPFVLTAGAHTDWKLTIFGFAEADGMWDSTSSFNDGLNNGVIAHPLTQAGRNPRFQMTIRNSRIGFKAQMPESHGVRSSAVLEFDLFGNQPTVNSGGGSPGVASGPGATTEAAYFNNAGLRVRHAYMKIEDDIVDVLAGQTYYLLGWQNYFFGATCGFLGMPNQLFNRTVQLRLSHTFQSDSVSFDLDRKSTR